jgi:hypothetical protein
MRSKTSYPLGTYPLGTPRLTTDLTSLEEGGRTSERDLAREAVRRGAEPGQVFDLLWKWRQARGRVKRAQRALDPDFRAPSRQPSFRLKPIVLRDEFADVAADWDAPIDTDMIRWEHQRCRLAALSEFEAFPALVRQSFGVLPEPKKIPTPKQAQAMESAHEKAAEKYVRMRALYYVFGYSDPPRFLNSIQAARVLEHDVEYGVHPKFAERLGLLSEAILKRDPSLRGRVSTVIKSAIGLQPRPIAGESKPTISNHAFGLAVDLDATTNPMIKDRAVIGVLNSVVGEPSFDFGRFAVDPKENPHLLTETAYARLREASLRVQDWLKHHLYDVKLSLPEDPEACRDLQSREVADENVTRMRILTSRVPWKELEAWARNGILTIPLALVLALRKDLNFEWGGEYNHSKDMMHFELRYWDIIPRDEGLETFPKGKPCRPLEALFPKTSR